MHDVQYHIVDIELTYEEIESTIVLNFNNYEPYVWTTELCKSRAIAVKVFVLA